jgi:UDP-glucose:(heptosyl)LPS alpha-1,3-glucosyltransferase
MKKVAHSIHIVRRYGLVGGMENYVVQLVSALVSLHQKVTILCEVDEYTSSPKSVRVVELGNRFRKPRWLAQWDFSQRVSHYLELHPDSEAVIHSHERTAVHHVTTFHGPPFQCRKKRILDFLSPRIHMWSYLERRELQKEQVQAILPNSPMIAGQLVQLYPEVRNRVLAPAYPGVTAEFSNIQRQSDGRTVVGFLGHEWRRKGLDIACLIVSSLRELLPEVHFLVAGCDPKEIQPLFIGWPKGSYTLAGWVSEPEQFLGKIDVLLHPARSEPFGMVVAEANAASIPVVISEYCGVAELIGEEQGSVCVLNVQHPEVAHWVAACYQWLMQESPVIPLSLTWEGLAEQHIALYQQLLLQRLEQK